MITPTLNQRMQMDKMLNAMKTLLIEIRQIGDDLDAGAIDWVDVGNRVEAKTDFYMKQFNDEFKKLIETTKEQK